MIDRQHGKLVFECDTCEGVFESGTGHFATAWEAAKAEGWRAHSTDGKNWQHFCGECRGE